MAYANGVSTIGNRGFIPVIYSEKLLLKLDLMTAAMNCVNHEWEGEISDAGDIVQIRQVGEISVQDYTRDQTITYQLTSDASTQNLVIDQAKYYAFRVDDIDQQQSNVDVMDAYAERGAIAYRNVVDSFLLNLMAVGTPAINTIGSGALGGTITATPDNLYALMVDLYTLLAEGNVFGATSQRPWALVPPAIQGVMKKSSQFTHATDMGDAVLRDGVIGEFAGFDIKLTTNQPYTAASTTTDAYYQIQVGTNLATTYACQFFEKEDIRLQTTIADAARALGVYGGKVVLPRALAKAYLKVA